MNRASFLETLIRSEPVRVVQLLAGAVLMLAAPIIAIPTPPPTGIVIFALGLALVLRNSRWARRRYVRYTRRHPRVQRAMNFGLRRKSKRKPVVLVPAMPGPADPSPDQTAGSATTTVSPSSFS